jgi:hypothetical protein
LNRIAIALFGAATFVACFDKDATLGLPCASDEDCAGSQKCEEGVCGGPDAASGDDPCSTGRAECWGAATLAVCSNGTPVQTTCTEYCELSGKESLKCAEGYNGASCYCQEDTGTCGADSVSCTMGYGVQLTSSGGVMSGLDCDELCVNQSQGSTGCNGSGCGCAAQPCTENATYCRDDATQRRCQYGTWIDEDCSTLCGGTASIGCAYDPSSPDYRCRCAT